MDITILWPDKLKHIPNRQAFADFTQKQVNRLLQGFCRYGGPDKRRRYLTRMEHELAAYKSTGNAEHLYNLANYCSLECYAPQHPRFHFDNTVGSATRGKV
jgi:hypothetical protein